MCLQNINSEFGWKRMSEDKENAFPGMRAHVNSDNSIQLWLKLKIIFLQQTALRMYLRV